MKHYHIVSLKELGQPHFFRPFLVGFFQVNNKINHWIIRFIASTTSVAPANVPEGVMELYSYPLVMADSLLLKMAIEIVSFPIKNGDFP